MTPAASPLERVEQLVKALKPVIGSQADRYRTLWLVSDFKQRWQVEQQLQLLHDRHLARSGTPVLPPPSPADLDSQGLHVGKVVYQGKPYSDLQIPVQSLLRHVMISGATGTGKTTLIYQFARELLRLKIPFFLFDFKLDYRPLVQVDPGVLVYTVGRTVKPFPFNPLLELCRHLVKTGAARDLSPLFQLSDILCRVFYTGHGVRTILNRAFAHLFHEWTEHDGAADYEPTFRRALDWVREHEPKAERGMRFKDWKVSTIRVLEALSVGTFGDAVNCASAEHTSLDAVRDKAAVFELNLSEDLKTTFVETLLLSMRQANLELLKKRVRGRLRNVMIIDESHNLLREHDYKIESQLQLALREDRGLGTAYILADQTPSQIDVTAYANTYYKLFFALDQADDIRAASKSLLLKPEQRDYLAKLPPGLCICRFGKHDAFVVRVRPADDVKHVIVTDEQLLLAAPDPSVEADPLETRGSSPLEEFERAVRQLGVVLRETDWSLFQAEEEEEKRETREAAESRSNHREAGDPGAKQASPESDKVLNTIEQKLLDDILADPFAGINQRYARIGVSTTNGRRARQTLEANDFLTVHTIALDRGGQLQLAALTKKAVLLLRSQGKKARWPYFANGGEHEYWKHRAERHFAARGYDVVKEPGVNGYSDLIATKGPERIAIEVETGKSDTQANIEKHRNKGFSRIILLATTKAVLPRLRALACRTGDTSVEVWSTSQISK